MLSTILVRHKTIELKIRCGRWPKPDINRKLTQWWNLGTE